MIDYLREELEQLGASDRRCLMKAALNTCNDAERLADPMGRVMRAVYWTLREFEDADRLVAKAEDILRDAE